MKLKSAARLRLFKDQAAKLRALKFEVLEQPANMGIQATAPCGRRFAFYPTKKKWMELGAKVGQPERHHGDVADFYRAYRPPTAAALSEAEWTAARPSVTIFSDAALCPRTGAAGWGAWMKGSARPSVMRGGSMRLRLKSSTEAEAQAGANAFHAALHAGLITRGATVMWQSDSIHALKWLLSLYPMARDRPAKDGLATTRPRKVSEAALLSPGANALHDFCQEHQLRVLVRHVKGHQEGPNRQWVNRQCDEIAGRHMRESRKRLEAADAGHCPKLYGETRP